MGFGSPLHWIILMLVVVLLFGSGRISSLMGDVAKGIKSFKKGMADDEDEAASVRPAQPVQQIEAKPADPVAPPAATPVPEEHKQG